MENGDSTVRERADTEQVPHWPVRAALASLARDQDYLQCTVMNVDTKGQYIYTDTTSKQVLITDPKLLP